MRSTSPWTKALCLLLISLTSFLDLSVAKGNWEQLLACEDRIGTFAMKRPKYWQQCIGKVRTYSKAAVATEDTECSRVGREILEQGGHAVDAAVAVVLCLGVRHPESAGLGGSTLMTVYNRDGKKVSTIDGRSAAPAAADDPVYLLDHDAYFKGARAIAIPGTVAALSKAHNEFGRLPWAELFEPSLKMLEKGIPLSFSTADALVLPDLTNETLIEKVKHDPMFKSLYLNTKTGEPKEEGEIVFYPELLRTYKRLSKYGGKDFYHGEIARDIIAELAEEGGFITPSDLSSYEAKRREPIVDRIAGHTSYGMPPPSSSAMINYFFHVLEGYNWTAQDRHQGAEHLALVYHRMMEASKFMTAQSEKLGDPDFSTESEKIIDRVMSSDFITETRSKIDDKRTHYPDLTYYDLDEEQDPKLSTSHVSILDKDGNAVSVTASINLHFGSTVIGKKTGIIYNNEILDFAMPKNTVDLAATRRKNNSLRAGKRPSTNSAPFVMVDNDDNVVLVGGASGGGRITGTIGQVLVNLFLFNMSLKEAIDDSRFISEVSGPPVIFIHEFKHKEVLPYLAEKGHQMFYYCYIPPAFHGIMVNNGSIQGYTDPRKFGCCDGY